MSAPPRLRSRIGQAEGPEDVKGKWFFEISLWDFTGENLVGPPWGPFGPYNTRKEAEEESGSMIRMLCDQISMKATGKKSEGYVDFKNGGVFRPWENHS